MSAAPLLRAPLLCLMLANSVTSMGCLLIKVFRLGTRCHAHQIRGLLLQRALYRSPSRSPRSYDEKPKIMKGCLLSRGYSSRVLDVASDKLQVPSWLACVRISLRTVERPAGT